jgi:hypothetical protein
MCEFEYYFPNPAADEWQNVPAPTIIIWDLWGPPETQNQKNRIIREAGFNPEDNPQGGILTADWTSPNQTVHREGTMIVALHKELHIGPKFSVSKKTRDELTLLA